MVKILEVLMVSYVESHSDNNLVLYLVHPMVSYRDPYMARSEDQFWESHSVMLLVKFLALTKAYYSTLLMMKCSDLHLELQMVSHLVLMKELVSVIYLDYLVV